MVYFSEKGKLFDNGRH